MARGKKAKHRTETYTLRDEKVPRSQGLNSSVPARNLSKKDLGAVIFVCSNTTIAECLSKLIFGLPGLHFAYVKKIGPGLPLFLFNYSDRALHGIYEATCHGQMDINPCGWTENGSGKTQYPAQVRVRVRKQCSYLKEKQYSNILENNRHSEVHYMLELDRSQTAKLISLFESSPLTSSSANFYKKLSMQSTLARPLPDLQTKCEEENSRKSVTDYPKSGLPGERPSFKGKWASLFKDNPDSDAKCEGADTKRPCWGDLVELDEGTGSAVTSCQNEEVGPTEDMSGWEEETGAPFVSCWEERVEPSGNMSGWEEETGAAVASCWEERVKPSGNMSGWEEETGVPVISCWEEHQRPSGYVSGWEEENQIVQTQPAEEELVFNRENMMTNKQVEDVSFSSEIDKSNLDSDHSHLTLAAHNFETTSMNSSEKQFAIDELRKELEEVKSIAVNQKQKIVMLEKKLADAGTPLQQLRDRVMLLESQLQNTSSAGIELWNDELIYTIGGYDGMSCLSTVDCYSPYTDTMKSLKPMSSARSHASATMLDGFIYNFGGRNDFGDLWYDSAECYSPWKDEWFSCPSLSNKKGCLASACINNKIYAVGGGNGSDCFKEVEVFEPTLSRWILTQSMLQKRFASAAVELDGVLYVVGGYDGNNYLKSAERYDPREGSWSKIQSMSSSRGSHALTVLRGKLYALGGFDGNKYVSGTEIFDPCMGSWHIGDEMKQGRGFFTASVIGEMIYVMGGHKGSGEMVDSVEMYRLGQGWSVKKLKGIGKRCSFSSVVI